MGMKMFLWYNNRFLLFMLGMRIRQGEKSFSEVKSSMETQYSSIVENKCADGACPKIIFLSADDEKILTEGKYWLETDGWTVWTFQDLVLHCGLNASDYSIRDRNFQGFDLKTFPKDSDAGDMFVYTRELVISVTLLSLSSVTFCTMSSNLCRIAMLLKGDLAWESTHSLDSMPFFVS